jgi:ACS family hexuronate transporter-like MFS transporter
MPNSVSLRWFAASVFVLSSVLNYLDRNLLSALSPLIMSEFHFNQTGYGWLISAFSATYAISALIAGWALDRFGVNRSVYAAVTWWSTAAVGTGLVRGVPGLGVCRSALGIGESAGVSAVGKLNAIYLKPEERALGAALNQIGISVGGALAVYWGVQAALAHGWRWPFMIAGLCGFGWLPLWWFVSRAIPAQFREIELATDQERRAQPWFAIFRERNLLILVLANLLWMGGYSLWSSWTTMYLTHVHNISLEQSRHYAWIPPLVSNIGGFFGGWLSLRWSKQMADPVAARLRAIWVAALCSLVTLVLPFASDVRWATALISASFFFALAGSVNIYALPIDVFGAKRSGMALAALTFSYGLLQTVISPIIGYLSDHKLYSLVIWLVTVPLILSAIVLQRLKSPIKVTAVVDR